MKTIVIHTEHITLGQFLKLSSCIQTGGQAKGFIQTARIYVNHEAENRRGKKLIHNDIVAVEGFGKFRVVQQ